MPIRINALDQALDIAGSLSQSQNMTITDEPNFLGALVIGQSGTSATISNFASNISTITGLTGMTALSVGKFLTISGANIVGNNGNFLIIAYHSSSSVDISNSSGNSSESNNGSLMWQERGPYTLQDDINYIRTDRKLIKGTTNWYDNIPTYQRPNAIGTSIPTNLTNIAGNTTDAVAYTFSKAFYGQTISISDGYTILSSPSNFKHADSVNKTGIPCFDLAPFINDWTSCYVHIVDGYSTGGELTVKTGPHAGERIFGITRDGYSISPNSVTVKFYSSPHNVNYTTTNTPYTWESNQVTTINLLYGYNNLLNSLDINAFRSVPVLGILTDAAVAGDVSNILQTIGTGNSDTSLSGLLTNISGNYIFANLPDANPSVVEAFNTLNTQIGDRTYTGSYLTNGQTIAQSLQALSNSITVASITRIIERLGSDINANSPHTLPGAATYTTDGTNNGLFLWVFTRGILRDPGVVSGSNDYEETSSTSITFYSRQKSGDHINYFIKS